MSKNTILKAIHNIIVKILFFGLLRIMSKNTILKAIHNHSFFASSEKLVENHE